MLLPSAEFVLNGRNDRPRRLVEKVPGMEAISSHQWRWSFQGHAAEVNVAPGDTIRISLDLSNPPRRIAALAANYTLPGNLRYARRARRWALLADTQLDGQVHLTRSFDEIRSGLLLALDARPCEESPQPLGADEVRFAINACHWPEDQVLQLDDAWEFHPRLRGDAAPVRVAIDGPRLRLSRTVVANHGAAVGRGAVAEQALRFNEQLRHARLAMADEALVAEALLHSEQLSPTWLETACRAVAVACRHTRDILNILADSNEIADSYAAMFISVEEEEK